MSVDVNTMIETLVRKRMFVFAVLGGIVLASLGIGYWLQTAQNREREAANLYDKTWQDVYTVISELQTAETTPERREAAANLYKESAVNLDTIVLDYPKTPAAARAALLVVRVSEEPTLKEILGTQVLESAKPGALDPVKKAHPKFWSAVIDSAEALRHEKSGRFAEANAAYENALAADKDKFISDFLLISIARNKEILQDKLGALKDYQSLISQYPASPWNNYAMGKVYLLSQAAPVSNQ